MQQTTQAECPPYYLLADGRQFKDFFEEECLIHLNDLDKIEFSRVESACEYYFRCGLKGGESEGKDWQKFTAKLSQAEDHYANRNPVEFDSSKLRINFTKIVKPVLALVKWEKDKKLSAAK
jgi:hypothetical protein